jgi:hypothetical protein
VGSRESGDTGANPIHRLRRWCRQRSRSPERRIVPVVLDSPERRIVPVVLDSPQGALPDQGCRYGAPLWGDYAIVKVKPGAAVPALLTAGLFDENWKLPKD